MDSARKEILERLQNTGRVKSPPVKPDFSSPIYNPLEESLPQMFKNKLESLGGNAYLCENEQQLFEELNNLIANNWTNIYCKESSLQQKLSGHNVPFKPCEGIPDNIEAGITGCECLVAHLGSIVVSSAQESGRKMFVYPPIHIIIAEACQIVGYLEDAYLFISDKYKKGLPSLITTITGPSRTADIEKTLIIGMHGPKEVHVFISK